jgi:hypothetical protein
MALAPCCSCVVAGQAGEFRERCAFRRLAPGLKQPLGLIEPAILDGRADAVVWSGGGRRRR